jgi:hypothetical protein
MTNAKGDEELQTTAVYPRSILIPKVVRNPKLKRFSDVPNLDAYLGVPIRYYSVLWDGAFI